MASSVCSSAMVSSKGKEEMPDVEEEVRFICPNFESDYIFGVLMLPRKFCTENSETLPRRLLLHVPPKVVWNGLYNSEKFCIEGVEKLMNFYSIKPYHLVFFEYRGGPSFNLEIYNPFAVEINYNIINKADDAVEKSKSPLECSDIEVDRHLGTLLYNAFNSGHGVYELVLSRSHLRKKESYKIIRRHACESLGLVESMSWVNLSFKNLAWYVKVKWLNGKVYFDRTWYKLAKEYNLKEGDTVVFQKTDKRQKILICVFDSDVMSQCNLKGVGHRSEVMSWYKIANAELLHLGKMEIPRVFTQVPGFSLSESVSLILRDGETVVVKFCGERNILFGMRKLIRLYSIEETDVLFFEFVRESTFVLSIFKVSGMESKYIADERGNLTSFDGVSEEDIIKISDSSDEGNGDWTNTFVIHGVADHEDFEANNEIEVPENNDMVEVHGGAENWTFRIALKRSHVDRKQHGAYCPRSMYSLYKKWTKATNIRLILGENISFVSVLRTGKMCRFARGWSEFTEANELEEGQILQLDYVGDLTFEVSIV